MNVCLDMSDSLYIMVSNLLSSGTTCHFPIATARRGLVGRSHTRARRKSSSLWDYGEGS
jgi:hypothetical protein